MSDVTRTGGGICAAPLQFQGVDRRRLPLVGVCRVSSCGADLIELLTRPRDGVRQVDDIEDFGPAEAGDLDSAHANER